MRQPQFHRIRRLPPYVFSEVNAVKAAARAAGQDIIDLGMGNPGWPVPSSPARMFVWAPLPGNYRDLCSIALSKLLLEEARVAVSPRIGFGERGEGYVRLALLQNRQRLRQAVRSIKALLARPKLPAAAAPRAGA